MTERSSRPAEQDRVRRVVCLQLRPDLECMGVWTSTSSALGAVVLLHDRDRDLDSMRAMAESLLASGLDVLNLDLPGHGLSGGVYARDGAAAIEAAADVAAAHGSSRVAYVAHGSSAGLLLAAEPTAPVAMFLLDPVDDGRAAGPAEVWQTVPTTVVHDPTDSASTESADRVLAGIRAWGLRISLHRTGGSDGAADLATGDGRVASPQVVVAATKFVLEQHTYAATAERVRQEQSGATS